MSATKITKDSLVCQFFFVSDYFKNLPQKDQDNLRRLFDLVEVELSSTKNKDGSVTIVADIFRLSPEVHNKAQDV